MKTEPTDPANRIVRTIPAHPESATIIRAHQVIPEAAIEAAHKAWREQAAQDGSIFEYNLRAAIEAAAPHLLAQFVMDAERQRMIADYERTTK